MRLSSTRAALSNLIRRYLVWLSAKLRPPNVIFDHEGSQPYLSRYYLLRGPRSKDGSHPFDEYGRPKENIIRTNGWSLVLHHFHQSDSTTKLHNHGWTWGLSFVLVGGYSEEKLVGDQVIPRTIKPFSFNFIRPSEFHRVDLLEQDAWTIFIRGPRLKEWFYKDRTSHEIVKWNEHVKLASGQANG
jgi:hypothetical protein